MKIDRSVYRAFHSKLVPVLSSPSPSTAHLSDSLATGWLFSQDTGSDREKKPTVGEEANGAGPTAQAHGACRWASPEKSRGSSPAESREENYVCAATQANTAHDSEPEAPINAYAAVPAVGPALASQRIGLDPAHRWGFDCGLHLRRGVSLVGWTR